MLVKTLAASLLALSLGGAGAARAATVAVVHGEAQYKAAPAEANDLRVDVDGSQDPASPDLVFRESGAPLLPGPGCVAQVDGSVRCARVQNALIRLADRADRAFYEVLGEQAGRVEIRGHGEDDRIHVGTSGDGDFTVDGGDGDDELTSAVNHGGSADLSGADGDDLLFAREGGGGTLEGRPGDDRVFVEGAFFGAMDGGYGRDLYRFGEDPSSNGVEPDRIVPGPSIDTLTLANQPFGASVDLAACGGCVENVIGSPFEDTILGSAAANHLRGGDGADLLDPRAGRDDVDGEGGDDVLGLRDSERDTASCGGGGDTVEADAAPFDLVAPDCESVARL
jgi:Ca2+-binding RTX toxin-like protein